MAECKATRSTVLSSLLIGVCVVAVVFLIIGFTVLKKDDSTDSTLEPGPCDRGDGHDDYVANGTDIAINNDVNAYLVEPIGSCLAAVVVIHDIYGYEMGATRLVADELASRGYTAVMPDLYRGNPWNGTGDFAEWKSQHPQDRIDRDVDATLDYIHTELDIANIGMVGFCFGGRQTVLASAPSPGRLQAGVGFYGVGTTTTEVLSMQAPTLLVYGQNDTGQPLEGVHVLQDALRDANRLLDDPTGDDSNLDGPASFIKIFDDVGHAFVHRADRNDPVAAAAADDAKQDMYYWLNRYLPTESEQVWSN
ncbi:carboxymethylenebutenolidase homolog [Ptychodera flava]|uniref:carboxymethylenebutenolidase homolog n=1 Tax=Ptychodera flava TaxID=63121 RepID=UPI00396A4287